MPDVARNETAGEIYFRNLRELRELGRYGYMEKYPEMFDPSWRDPNIDPKEAAEVAWRCARREEAAEILAQIGDLKQLTRQFPGTEATYIRWLIDNEIRGLYHKKEVLFERDAELRQAPPPTPEWMEEYIAPTVSEEGRRPLFGRREPTDLLRPLGAQAELQPEQLGLMAGYQAWRKAGAPAKYSEEAILKMADWRKEWDPYTKLSQSLFPTKAKLGTRWSTAAQR